MHVLFNVLRFVRVTRIGFPLRAMRVALASPSHRTRHVMRVHVHTCICVSI